jgi:hypothetical protein
MTTVGRPEKSAGKSGPISKTKKERSWQGIADKNANRSRRTSPDPARVLGPALTGSAHFEDAGDAQRFGKVFELDPLFFSHVHDPAKFVVFFPKPAALDRIMCDCGRKEQGT